MSGVGTVMTAATHYTKGSGLLESSAVALVGPWVAREVGGGEVQHHLHIAPIFEATSGGGATLKPKGPRRNYSDWPI